MQFSKESKPVKHPKGFDFWNPAWGTTVESKAAYEKKELADKQAKLAAEKEKLAKQKADFEKTKSKIGEAVKVKG